MSCLHECTQQEVAHYAYSVAGGVSLAFCIIQIISYSCSQAVFRQSPSDILLLRSISDSFFSVSFLFGFLVKRRANNCSDYAEVVQCTSVEASCIIVGWIAQFGVFASSGWWGMLAVNLFRSIRNPFSNQFSNTLRYHFMVWPVAIASSILAHLFGALGLSSLNFCWLQASEVNLVNWRNWVFFFGPMLCFWFFSVATLIFVWWTGTRLPRSHSLRMVALKQGAFYTIVCTLYWALAASTWWIKAMALDNNERKGYQTDGSDTRHLLEIIMAVILGARGAVDLTIWLLSKWFAQRTLSALMNEPKQPNKKVIQYDSDEESQEMDDSHDKTLATPLLPPASSAMPIKWALRKDIMSSCQQGICAMATRAAEDISNLQEDYILRKEDFEQKVVDKAMQRLGDAQEKSTFHFTDYAAIPFHFLREVYGVSSEEYCKVFGRSGVDTDMLEKFSEGRSGSFFYFTCDRRYIVKTINTEEQKLLLRLLPDYFAHFQKHRNSLIVKFFGLHAIQMHSGGQTMFFVVMDNVFASNATTGGNSLTVDETYDLKGSWVDRCTGGTPSHDDDEDEDADDTELSSAIRKSFTEKAPDLLSRSAKDKDNHKGNKDVKKPKVGVMKDMDLKKKIWVGEYRRSKLLQQLQHDCNFFQCHNIMDYSLLLGVHRSSWEEVTSLRDQCDVQTPSSMSPSVASDTGMQFDEEEDNQDLMSVQTVHAVSSKRQRHKVAFFRAEHGGILSSCLDESLYQNDGVYFFGTIDILQQYNWNKKMERFLKTTLLRKNGSGLSSINPEAYGARFMKRMEGMLV